MTARKEEPLALQPFIPLRAAAAMAYSAVTKKKTSDMHTLNKVARLIASRIHIFTRNLDADSSSRVLPLEIQEGHFEKGGDQLHFADGRGSIRGLAILHRELPQAIAAVREAYRPDQVE